MAGREIVKRLFDAIQQLDGMRANLLTKTLYPLNILVLRLPFRETAIGFDQAPGKIHRPITHEVFYLIDHSLNLRWSQVGVIQKFNKSMRSLLKIDIILPESIIRINQEMIAHSFSFLSTQRLFI